VAELLYNKSTFSTSWSTSTAMATTGRNIRGSMRLNLNISIWKHMKRSPQIGMFSFSTSSLMGKLRGIHAVCSYLEVITFCHLNKAQEKDPDTNNIPFVVAWWQQWHFTKTQNNLRTTLGTFCVTNFISGRGFKVWHGLLLISGCRKYKAWHALRLYFWCIRTIKHMQNLL